MLRGFRDWTLLAVTDSQITQHLGEFLQNTDDPDLQLSIAHALGAIGTDESKEIMIAFFLEGNDYLRQAIAESFASMPDDGYPTLYDALKEDDIHIRRSALFGIRRIEAAWATELIRENISTRTRNGMYAL